MTEGRIANTKETARRLGISTRILLSMSEYDSKFPKPIRNTKHHKWWDFKAIEQYLDNINNIDATLPNWNNKILEGLSGGNNSALLS